MSNLINKAKDALSGNKTHHDAVTTSSPHHTTGGHGPYDSSVANTADPRIDSTTGATHHGQQGHHTTGGYGTTGGHGPHHSSAINAADPRFDSNTGAAHHGQHGQHPVGTSSSAAGPHNSNLMNKLDPRVDSGDNRNDPTSRVGGYGTQDTYGSTTGHTGAGGLAGTTHTGTGGFGGNTGHAGTGGLTGSSGHTGGYTGNSSSNTGPHNSNMMNQIDPRVDSDRDNRNDPTSQVGGYGAQDTYGGTTGHTGQGALSSNTGHTGGHTGGHHGGAPGTTGAPGYGVTESKRVHDSTLLNKLDPATKTDSAGRPI